MKINLKLKPISALKIKGFLCVLAGVIRVAKTRFDEKCNSQKSFEQEKKSHFKICIFQCKIFILGARQATYNHIPLKELKTMNIIKAIMNFFQPTKDYSSQIIFWSEQAIDGITLARESELICREEETHLINGIEHWKQKSLEENTEEAKDRMYVLHKSNQSKFILMSRDNR